MSDQSTFSGLDNMRKDVVEALGRIAARIMASDFREFGGVFGQRGGSHELAISSKIIGQGMETCQFQSLVARVESRMTHGRS